MYIIELYYDVYFEDNHYEKIIIIAKTHLQLCEYFGLRI